MKPETRQLLLFQILLVIITAAVFAQSMDFPLLAGWDDHEYVLSNTGNLVFNGGMGIVNSFNRCYVGNYIPLTMLSYVADYNLFGLNPLAYHIQNLLWHLAAVIGLFHCLRYFRINPVVVFFMTLIFAIHPQRCESVVWVSERKDVLCAALYFWSIWFYLRAGKRTYSVAAFALFILALLAKPMAISLPAVFLLIEFHFRKDFNITAYLKKLWPYIIIALIFVPVTVYAQGTPPEKTVVLTRRLFAVCHNVIWYVEYTLFPRNLSPIYPRIFISLEIIIRLAAGYIIALAACFWLWKRNSRDFLYEILPLILAFLAALAPVSGIFQLGSIDWADRYSYIPCAFIWLGAGLIVSNWLKSGKSETSKVKRKQLLLVFGCAYCFYLAATGYFYAQTWKSYPAVLEAACEYEPANYMALAHFGSLNFRNGNFEKSLELSNRIIERRPGWLYHNEIDGMLKSARCVKAFSLYRLGRKQEATNEFNAIRDKMTRKDFGTERDWQEFLKTIPAQ
jgi:hypothetical protein